jgi:arabinose-5-phosphate isomerase
MKNMNSTASSRSLALARQVLIIESDAVRHLADRIDAHFHDALMVILNCKGRVVVTGMGKSGHVARKIAATLASTGTPAFFVHPAEASHGDLGMITQDDVVIALSYSGESTEITAILPLIKRRGAKLIGMSGNPKSTLARESDAHLNGAVDKEAWLRWLSAMRWRSRSWMLAGLRPRTLPARIRAAAWDAGFWSMCAMSCIAARNCLL